MRRALEEKMVARAFGVYLGDRSLRFGEVRAFSLPEFLERLWAGEVLTVAPP